MEIIITIEIPDTKANRVYDSKKKEFVKITEAGDGYLGAVKEDLSGMFDVPKNQVNIKILA